MFEHGIKYYLTFEDISRLNSDQDFNDLILMINMEPFMGTNPGHKTLKSVLEYSKVLVKTLYRI